MGSPKVFFRADGNSKIGLGHVVRSLALVDMLKDDFECYFIIREPSDLLKEMILRICENLIAIDTPLNDELESNSLIENYFEQDDIVVLDGYNFRTEYQLIIRSKGCKLVCIDDIHSYHFVADIVVNHAGGINRFNYSGEAYTKYWLGLKYALLRKPFLEAIKNRNTKNRNSNNIFICLGGADPDNNVIRVLDKCKKNASVKKCYIVLGSAYLFEDSLNEFLNCREIEIEILRNLNADEMVDYMGKCGRAITSPSTISYEYLSVGGELYLLQTASNQSSINEYFLNSKVAFSFDDFPIKDEIKIDRVLNNQIDCLGSNIDKRYINNFKSLANA